MATFHERLRELRIQKGFSQQDLADRIDQTKKKENILLRMNTLTMVCREQRQIAMN